MTISKFDLDKIESKIDKLDEKLDRVEVTLAINTQSLVEHVRRTNALEDKLDPVEKHVNLTNAGLKILAGVFALLMAVKAAVEIFKFFH